jgi:hypothetical protein
LILVRIEAELPLLVGPSKPVLRLGPALIHLFAVPIDRLTLPRHDAAP